MADEQPAEEPVQGESAVDWVHSSMEPGELMDRILALSDEEVETDWAKIQERLESGGREYRQQLVRSFDSVGDGVVDPSQLDDFVEEENRIRRQQSADLRAYLLEQYDADGDGRLMRAELKEVFEAFRRITDLERNSEREKLARISLELRLFDWENKGFLTPSEWVAAGRLREEAFRDGDPDDVISIPTPVRPRRVQRSSE